MLKILKLVCILGVAFCANAEIDTKTESKTDRKEFAYYVMHLESDCGCSYGSYKVVLKYADGKTQGTNITSDGLVYVPKQEEGIPDYGRIVGVGVVSQAFFPSPGRVIKGCSAMPYDPLQANWVPPQEGGVIPIYCP